MSRYNPEWVDADIPPEEAVKIGLAEWIEESGTANVYWEKQPSYWERYDEYRRERFTVKNSSGRKPDLLVGGEAGTYGVEVKDAEDSSNVTTGAAENFQYWKEYTFGQAEYICDGHEVDIDAFLLATQYSAEGALYRRIDSETRDKPIGERLAGIDPPVHFLPKWEYEATKGTVRMMWRLAKFRAQEAERESWSTAPGIGAVLSAELDWDSLERLGIGGPDPFDRVRALSGQELNVSPQALYKRPVSRGNPVKTQNWRWVDE